MIEKFGWMVCAVMITLTSLGCGRYQAPLPPEYFAPKPIDALAVTPGEDGISLAWIAPDEDQRGKELKSIEGYDIQRKTITEKGDETDPKVRFESVGFVKDQHVEVRERLRKEARAEGRIGRTIKSPAEFTKFTFVDSKVQLDKTYIYQVVPLNQGGTEGGIRENIRVTFRGKGSEVTSVPVVEAALAATAAPAKRAGLF